MRSAGLQNLDLDHAAVATDRALPEGRAGELFAAIAIVLHRVVRLGFRHAQQGAAAGEFRSPVAVAEQAVVADPLKAVRQDMEQEAADELVSVERHRLSAAALAIILPAE